MSGSIRLFLPAPLAAGLSLVSSPGQAHYLGAVMRRAPGDTVRLFNGRDGEWQARVQKIRRDQAEFVVETLTRPQAPEADIFLAFAPLKRDATDLLVQKATELGAAALLPVFSERTNATRVNLDRLRAIAIEAAEQCERLTVPEIRPPVALAALLAAWPADRKLFVALERASVPPLCPASGPVGLLIGPEGGFSPVEHAIVIGHRCCHPVSLGPRVLRAETAAIVGLALLQAPGCG